MTRNTPLVSAIILTYNQAAYIAQAIECALNQQTDFDYEILIGEDCSNDGTREIVFDYQQRYSKQITVVTSDRNVGLLDNYCRTVRQARGKYIAGCSGDDYWHNPAKTQMQADFLERNPDCGMVHADANFLYEDEGFTVRNACSRTNTPFSADGHFESFLAGEFTISAGTVMFRKSFFDGYFNIHELKQNSIVMEDTPLWCEIAARSRVAFMPQSFLTHREMIGTFSSPGPFKDKLAFCESCYRCSLHYLEKYEAVVTDKQRVLRLIDLRFNRSVFKAAFAANERGTVRHSYRRIAELSNPVPFRTRLRYFVSLVPLGPRFFEYVHRNLRKVKYRFGTTPVV